MTSRDDTVYDALLAPLRDDYAMSAEFAEQLFEQLYDALTGPDGEIRMVDRVVVASTSTRSRHGRLFAGSVAAVVLVAVVVGSLLARHDAPSRIKVGGPGPATTTPAVAAYAGCKGKVYVSGVTGATPGGPGMVWAITTATGAVSAPIKVGGSPGAVAVTPDGKYAYVVSNDDGTVSVISTATDVVSDTITVGGRTAPASGGASVAITPDGKYVYVTRWNDGTVSVITTATGAVSAPIKVGPGGPSAVAITPDGTYAYVTTADHSGGNDNKVSVIATATGKVSATVPLAAGPSYPVITPDGAHVYVTSEDRVWVITTATNKVSATIPGGFIGGPAGGVAITPDGTHLYLARLNDTVAVISTATNAVSGTITFGGTPGGVAITPDGTQAYVTDGGAQVRVITTATGKLSAPIKVGDSFGFGGLAACPSP